MQATAGRLIQAALSYLTLNPDTVLENVCFLAWNARDLEACTAVLDASEETRPL